MLQTKQKNQKRSTTGAGTKSIKKFLWIGLRRALFCFCMLILALSMLTVYTMSQSQEITIKAMQYLAFSLCGIDFLLCGVLSAKHPQASPIKDGLYASIVILLFLFLACLLASNGHFGNKIYLLPIIAILCCVLGILFGLKINVKSKKVL